VCQQEYMGQGRRARALLRRYLGKMTGLSRAQLRLVGRYLATGRVRIKTSHRHRFPTRYTRADIELLAQVDEAHETLSGPAIYLAPGGKNQQSHPAHSNPPRSLKPDKCS
jgi:hypothetical protein